METRRRGERRVGGHDVGLVCPERVDGEAPARLGGEDERLVERGHRCELVELLTSTKSQTEKSLWKQTRGATNLWRRAAFITIVESARRSPNSWPPRECHGRPPYVVKHLSTCVPAKRAMSVRIRSSRPPFRIAADVVPRKTDGAPHRPINDACLIGSVAERHSS